MSITAVDISFQYRVERNVLVDWSHSFQQGAVTALTGPSGAGKSTLLYILGLVLKPSSGRVIVDGKDVQSLKDEEKSWLRATRFGFVFQDAALDMTRSVLDNVTESALYRGVDRNKLIPEAKNLIAQMGVDVPGHSKPGEISGGQAQRIALCRALLHRPEFLLADEPTGNLDSTSAQVVLGAFAEHARLGNTVIVVSHDPEVIRFADEVVNL